MGSSDRSLMHAGCLGSCKETLLWLLVLVFYDATLLVCRAGRSPLCLLRPTLFQYVFTSIHVPLIRRLTLITISFLKVSQSRLPCLPLWSTLVRCVQPSSCAFISPLLIFEPFPRGISTRHSRALDVLCLACGASVWPTLSTSWQASWAVLYCPPIITGVFP